jgi:hypothetical protein
MSRATLFLLLVTAFIEVFLECWFDGFRRVLGAQISFLPALMVYTGLTATLPATCLVAVCGGMWLDSLSSNPLGISILPLIVVGWGVYVARDFFLRDQTVAQFFAGAAGSLVAPVLTLLLVYTLMPSRSAVPLPSVNWEHLPTVEGEFSHGGTQLLRPSLSWHMGVKLLLMALGGALATPLVFRLFDFLNRIFNYSPVAPSSFRADRQIIRGRQ